MIEKLMRFGAKAMAWLDRGTSTTPIFDKIEAMIRRKEDVAEIAAYFVSQYETNEVQFELGKFDGDLEALLSPRLQQWADDPANHEFLSQLSTAFNAAYAAAQYEFAD